MNVIKKDIKIAVIGLGYVGLPLAVTFSEKFNVTGFDLDKERIRDLKKGLDKTNELNHDDIINAKNLVLTCDENMIKDSNVYIVTVPTPVDKNNNPDLGPLISATKLIGGHLSKNNIVIYESTVYPGCTEEVCVPILSKVSGLQYNLDFFCGYSPERINPGDKHHTLTKIIKVTSGSNKTAGNFVEMLYESIINAGTFKASSIKVAEAAKVIENTQRDVNIALINELSIIFDKMKIDTNDVLDAANTKWNFIPFRPGLVGGHCIGVDPYYLTHKASELGYHPEIILAGRRINDNMGNFIAEKTISKLTKIGINPIGAKIGVLGLTFKENCPDLRNTKVTSILQALSDYKCHVEVTDSWADKKNAKKYLDINLVDMKSMKHKDAVIIPVAHKEYCDLSYNDFVSILRPNGLVVDVKSIFTKRFFSKKDITHWRL